MPRESLSPGLHRAKFSRYVAACVAFIDLMMSVIAMFQQLEPMIVHLLEKLTFDWVSRD